MWILYVELLKVLIRHSNSGEVSSKRSLMPRHTVLLVDMYRLMLLLLVNGLLSLTSHILLDYTSTQDEGIESMPLT